MSRMTYNSRAGVLNMQTPSIQPDTAPKALIGINALVASTFLVLLRLHYV